MKLFKNLLNIYKYNGIDGVFRKVSYKLSNGYNKFLKNENIPNRIVMTNEIKHMEYQPLISIITPIYKPVYSELEAYFFSILEENPYDNIELCLVIDGDDDEKLLEFIKKYQQKYDFKIKLQKNEENRGIASASNDAIQISSGEYLALIDQDDIIAPHAFYEYLKALQCVKYDFLYSDEDLIDTNGKRFSPNFKPDWSPHTLLSRMYVNHLSMYKRSIINEVNGFDESYNGAQDYDLLLRASKYFKNVFHSSEILYHWRTSKNSIASNIDNKKHVITQAITAIESYFQDSDLTVSVKQHDELLMYDIELTALSDDLISVIMPFKNNFSTTKLAIDSLIDKNKEINYEIILVDNQSIAEQMEKYERYINKIDDINIKIVKADYDFNYSKINNDAAKIANGNYLLFLNNDVEFIEENVLQRMLGIAKIEFSGAVGCTLYFPDDTIQHAGVVLGYHEVAGHSGVGQVKNTPGYYGRNVSLVNFSAVTGACLMVEKSKFFEVNGFDEALQVAYNDVDFCLKLLGKGYFNVNAGNIHMRHHESKTRGYDSLNNERYQKECAYMWKKWPALLKNDPFYNKNLSINVGELYQIKRNR